MGIYACEDPIKEPTDLVVNVELAFAKDNITPIDFPDLQLPKFNFPEDSNILNGWIYNNDTTKIYTHVWGLWKGLMTQTRQVAGQHPLRVYETWLTPDMMKEAMRGEAIVRSNRPNLRRSKQHPHFGFSINSNISESVAYSPAASQYAIDHKLMLAPDLYLRYYNQVQNGATNEEPNFPSDAMTIKPVFKVLKAGAGLQAIEVWPGGPTEWLAEGYSEEKWRTYVYVDVTNKAGQNTGKYGTAVSDTTAPPPTPAVTYNLDDFVHYALTEEDVHYFNKEFATNLSAGDYAILVGMHLSTKENKRWTWQSYWWAPDPANPSTPSRRSIASARSSVGLTGASNHYAAAVGYYMVNPQEPYSSSTMIKGEPNYAYNPYLEAPFDTGVFEPNTNLSFIEQPDGDTIPTYIGIRSNCLSCHGAAAMKFTNNKVKTLQYMSSRYLSLDDPMFDGYLKADFAWSLSGELDTTGLAAIMKAHPITTQ